MDFSKLADLVCALWSESREVIKTWIFILLDSNCEWDFSAKKFGKIRVDKAKKKNGTKRIQKNDQWTEKITKRLTDSLPDCMLLVGNLSRHMTPLPEKVK